MDRSARGSDARPPANTTSSSSGQWCAETPRGALLQQEVKQPGHRVTPRHPETPAGSAALGTPYLPAAGFALCSREF